MENSFKNKTVLITGASSGIGQATAVAFAKLGANIVVADINEGNETLKLIELAGGKGRFFECDVSKEKEIASLVHKAVKEYGSLDFAFNNAGIEGQSGLLQDIQTEDFEKIIHVNLLGVFWCMKYELQEMLKQGHGAIVNCASIAGLVGFSGMGAYVASKHGVVGLTKAVALENAKHNIRINAVCPGVIHTPMIDRYIAQHPEGEAQLTSGEPIGRMGKPEEIAASVVWLCSDSSSFTTGQAIAIDGGWVAQ